MAHTFSDQAKLKHELAVVSRFSLDDEARLTRLYYMVSMPACSLLIAFDASGILKWLCVWSWLGLFLSIAGIKRWINTSELAERIGSSGTTKNALCSSDQDTQMITKKILAHGGFEPLDQAIRSDMLKLQTTFQRDCMNNSVGMADAARQVGKGVAACLSFLFSLVATLVYWVEAYSDFSPGGFESGINAVIYLVLLAVPAVCHSSSSSDNRMSNFQPGREIRLPAQSDGPSNLFLG